MFALPFGHNSTHLPVLTQLLVHWSALTLSHFSLQTQSAARIILNIYYRKFKCVFVDSSLKYASHFLICMLCLNFFFSCDICHRNTELLRLKVTSRGPIPCSDSCPWPCPDSSRASRKMNAPQLSGQHMSMLHHLHNIPRYSEEAFYTSVCLHCILYGHNMPLKWAWLHLLCTFLSWFRSP